MFTGIVQGIATLTRITDKTGMRTFVITFPEGFCQGLEVGASVAVDGVCLTVTQVLDANTASFDVIWQSLQVSSLGDFAEGGQVNVERAAKDGAEIGGHPLSGHVDCCATVLEIRHQENNACLRFGVPEPWMRYIFAKGYIALNGVSLTVSEADRKAGWFEVWLIPETRRMTTFEAKAPGDRINVEIERSTQVMVDTVRDTLEEYLGDLLPALEALLAERGIELERPVVLPGKA
ncbi:MAG: riboflavin synthase subunit alpha [Thiothrix sp.]|nr:riboflavin synthase subunit alpha [Thiothrix sp.]HPQ94396.1 riboflavin synthase subunit alpha [Thiolinea sp.]